jgi:hypothetical protein
MTSRFRWLAPPPSPVDAQPLGTDLPLAAAARALSIAADENILTLVIVGWSRAAWDLLRTEPRLAARSVQWIISACDVAALEAAAGAPDPEEDGHEITVAAVSELPEVAQAFAAIGGVFSLAVMSTDGDLLFRLQMMRIDNFVRQTRSLDRALKDFRHLVARLGARREFALVESWKGLCDGAAAVCVAAGPGLDQSVDLLRRLAVDCVVICVDVAYRKLSAAGVRCDYVLNVDSHDAAVARMEGVPAGGATLVMPMDGNARADAWFPSIAHFVSPALAGPLFGQVGPDFARGTNVGAATVGWALHLGCSEIVLLGHDLSFPAETAYSSFVPDHEQHGRDMLAKVGRLIAVPGNAGGDVMTDHAFKIACSDLSALVRAARNRATIYNYNINLGRGARIEQTLALPDGWSPPTGVRHRPAQPQVRTALLDGSGLVAQVSGLVNALSVRWAEMRTGGADVLDAIERIGAEAELGFAKDLLWPAVTGHLLHLIRLKALRTGEASAAQVRSAEAGFDGLMQRWLAYVLAQIGGVPRPEPPLQLPPEGARFLASLAPHVPRLRQDSFEGALTPMLARERLSLRHHFTDLPVPLPPTVDEACNVLARVGAVTPAREITELLCMCSLEGERLGFVLDVAVQAHLLDRPQVGADTLADWLRDAAPDIVAAHDGLLALMGSGTCPEIPVLHAILAWHPSHVPLIVALLRGRPADPARVAALERLVADDALPLDDAIVGTIIALHPDPLGACTLLERRLSVTGPATALAIARRLLDIGDLAGARGQFAAVGSLGRCAEDRLAMEGAYLVEHGRLDELLGILAGWPDPEAGYRVLYRILAGRLGPMPAVQALASDPRAMLDPTLVGGMLAGQASRREALPAAVAQASRQLLGRWLEEPRTIWDREQADQTLQVLEHYAGLAG